MSVKAKKVKTEAEISDKAIGTFKDLLRIRIEGLLPKDLLKGDALAIRRFKDLKNAIKEYVYYDDDVFYYITDKIKTTALSDIDFSQSDAAEMLFDDESEMENLIKQFKAFVKYEEYLKEEKKVS